MKAIIIDDERLARKELTSLLADFPEIEIVDEAVNADDATLHIEQGSAGITSRDGAIGAQRIFFYVDNATDTHWRRAVWLKTARVTCR